MLTAIVLYVVASYVLVALLVRSQVSCKYPSPSRDLAVMTVLLAPGVVPLIAIGYPALVLTFGIDKYILKDDEVRYVFWFWRNY